MIENATSVDNDPLHKRAFLQEIFSRNIGLISEREQECLHRARIAIPGMGGVGGIHLVTLARLGIGQFHCADFDVFEPANSNRQYGAKTENFGRPKLTIMCQEAQLINPYLEIGKFSHGLSLDNLDSFLNGVDIVIDSLDFFAIDIRRSLFKRAHERGIHVITAGPIGFGCSMIIFSPDSGMSFDEYFAITDQLSAEEKALRFFLGLTPKTSFMSYMEGVDLSKKKGPSLGLSCNLCSAMAATEVVRILLRRGETKSAPYYHRFDPYSGRYYRRKLWFGNHHPIQRFKLNRLRKKLSLSDKARQSALTHPPVPLGMPNHIAHMINAGTQAPSGDNAQPWKFAYSHDRIDVYCDSEKDGSFFDTDRAASLISVGACIENIFHAASAVNLIPSVQYLPESDNLDYCASIRFRVGKTTPNPLQDAIWERHTNRAMYDQAAVREGELRTIQQSIDSFPGCRLHLISDPEELKKLWRLVCKADTIRVRNKEIHEHLHQMIRWKNLENTEDGLPIASLHAGILGNLILRATRSWKVANLINVLGGDSVIARAASRGILHCSGVGLLTTPSSGNKDLLLGGAAMQKLFLTLHTMSLSVHPMAALPLFFLRWQKYGRKGFSEQEFQLLERIRPEFQELFPLLDLKHHGQIMLFRFGYCSTKVPRSQRRSIESCLLEDRCAL